MSNVFPSAVEHLGTRLLGTSRVEGVPLFSSPSRARIPFPFHFEPLSHRLLGTLRSDNVTEKLALRLFHD